MLLCPGIQALLESQCSMNLKARSLLKSEKKIQPLNLVNRSKKSLKKCFILVYHGSNIQHFLS